MNDLKKIHLALNISKEELMNKLQIGKLRKCRNGRRPISMKSIVRELFADKS